MTNRRNFFICRTGQNFNILQIEVASLDTEEAQKSTNLKTHLFWTLSSDFSPPIYCHFWPYKVSFLILDKYKRLARLRNFIQNPIQFFKQLFINTGFSQKFSSQVLHFWVCQKPLCQRVLQNINFHDIFFKVNCTKKKRKKYTLPFIRHTIYLLG